MSTSEIKFFPRAQISMGAGDLVQVTSFSYSYTNNAKLKHSLKRSPSGKTLGNKEVSGKFHMEIDEDGPERDVHARIDTGEEVNLRFKLPSYTKNFVGLLSSVDVEGPLDDAVSFDVAFLGKFSQ